jgi:hypothetical protein
LAAAINAESSGLVTGALGNGLALAVLIYATAGACERVSLCVVMVYMRFEIHIITWISFKKICNAFKDLWRNYSHALCLFAGGNGSGGKLNPAVTAGLFITGFFICPTFHHFYPFRVHDNVNCLYVRA